MVKISWSEQAKNDLISIAEFIGQDSQKYARIQVKRIREHTSQLKTLPYSGRPVPEFEMNTIR